MNERDIQVLDAIRNGCQTSKQIRERTGIKDQRVLTGSLVHLRSQGKIEHSAWQKSSKLWAPARDAGKRRLFPTLINRYLMTPAGKKVVA